MRIAIDVVAAEYEPGGMLLAARTLLQGLARIDQSNEYIVLTVRPEDYQDLLAFPQMHVQAVRLPSRRGILIQHQLFMPAILKKVKPDMLHTPAFATPLSWRGPLVNTIHDLAFLKVPEQSSWYPRYYHMYVQRAAARRAQRVIAISEQTCEELTTYWSIPTARIRLIHHALRPSLTENPIMKTDIQAMQARYGQRYLLHVGRIMPRKNVERLLEAFHLLAGRLPDLHLVLTGGVGYGSERALQLIETSLYYKRIHLAGWVADEKMGALYAGASALIFPSKHEGQGMPSLEAMACGTPVVASYEAASSEIAGDAVLHADCTNTQSLADAILLILSDHTLRQRLIHLGCQRAQLFHYETCARATVQVYEEAWAEAHSSLSQGATA
ncbi:glycosyltransferase family 4 protein [Dictyobacter arantiisoli]|uniref:Glycosyl transferase family 1 n=1 Tax=Dictyobacter arantiisoli TaxID=2014874 RepID=A0A5A5T6M8_9CHLR|nr:glycosyltransferase family 1 protein [Dictyobacter arantiisoli]GCF06885.1 glycosyl transferase family 1 [Dictyobacter arantiisoli]